MRSIKEQKIDEGVVLIFISFFQIVVIIMLNIIGPVFSQVDPLFATILSAIKIFSGISSFLSFIFGVNNIVAALTRFDLLDLLLGSFSSVSEFDSKILKIVCIDGKHHRKYVKIRMKHLSEETAYLLWYNIQKPLAELYTESKECGKEDVFSTFEPYITTIGSELESAIRLCRTDEMEKKLLEKVPVVTQTIGWMEKKLQKEVQKDVMEGREIERLQNDIMLTGYHPMEVLENLNTLLRDGPGSQDVAMRLEKKAKREVFSKKHGDS